MLEYNEIRERTYINFEGEPYEIVASHVARKQQRKPVNQVKMKNLISGRVIEHTFQVSDKADEADLKMDRFGLCGMHAGISDLPFLENNAGCSAIPRRSGNVYISQWRKRTSGSD